MPTVETVLIGIVGTVVSGAILKIASSVSSISTRLASIEAKVESVRGDIRTTRDDVAETRRVTGKLTERVASVEARMPGN